MPKEDGGAKSSQKLVGQSRYNAYWRQNLFQELPPRKYS